MKFKLLETFKGLFEGNAYKHRDSSLGNHVASYFFEDLYDLGQSEKLARRIKSKDHLVNVKNVTTGKKALRGDGTFGIKSTARAL
jgi:hypothetical protein